MSEHREATRRAPWDRWWVLLVSTAALVAVVVVLVISAIGGGQSPQAGHPARAAATSHPEAARPTPSVRPTDTGEPAPARPGAGGHVRYTGAATGTASFSSAACIIGSSTVAEVDAPASTGGTAVTLSMTRTSGGLSVLLSGKYLHAGATPGVTVRHSVGRWSVWLQGVKLTGESTGTVTLNGIVDCTQTNEPG